MSEVQVDGEGVKADKEKTRINLIPPGFVVGVGDVLTFGARKYDAHNWMRGIKFSRILDALDRHVWKGIAMGEDLDPETGILHAYHAACNLAFLGYFTERPISYGQFDDRVFTPVEDVSTVLDPKNPEATGDLK